MVSSWSCPDAAPSSSQVGGGIEVSRNDDRDYAYARLENGMRIIVVSDPSVEQVSAPCGSRPA